MNFLKASIDEALRAAGDGEASSSNGIDGLMEHLFSNGHRGIDSDPMMCGSDALQLSTETDEGSENFQDTSNNNDGIISSKNNGYCSLDNGSNDLDQSSDVESPPILDNQELDRTTLAMLNQIMSATDMALQPVPPMSARSYREDVIPLERCMFHNNRLIIKGCKYEFVRLNVRSNIYYRCVVCYGIYQKRRSLVSRNGANVEVPSVGSLKYIDQTHEVRGNPNRPSGIDHCCEMEKFRDKLSTDASPSFSGLGSDRPSMAPSTLTTPDEQIFPLERCIFREKRLEIKDCKYVFSRTQSGPRDYYRCSACIALYHKRHFRKLPTPKIGSLSLVTETGLLYGNPEMPRGLAHICDDPNLQCPPLRGENRVRYRMSGPSLSAMAAIYELANQSGISSNGPFPQPGTVPNGIQNGMFKKDASPPDDFFAAANSPGLMKRRLSDAVNNVQDVKPKRERLSAGSESPSLNGSGMSVDCSGEPGAYPHSNDLLPPPRKLLPEFDLSFTKMHNHMNECFAQFPKLPSQARVIIIGDTLLRELDSKTLKPSATLVHADFPILPSHVNTLCWRVKATADCFSKTRHVFFALGYDVARCLATQSTERKIRYLQNQFLDMRAFFDAEAANSSSTIVMTFVTIPAVGPLADDLTAINTGMKELVCSCGREDIKLLAMAPPGQQSGIEDRLRTLVADMSRHCGTDLLDDD